MSSDALLLLLSGAAAAYGFWASLRGAPARHPATILAGVLFVTLGMHAALVVASLGAGEFLPGYQLNPDLQLYWAGLVLEGDWVAPHPDYLFAAIAAHVLAVVARPAKATFWRVLPATVAFLAILGAVDARAPVKFAASTENGRTAYLTVVPPGRVLFALGTPDQVFVPVLHEHESDREPPRPRLHWSPDGELVTFSTGGGRPFFAVDEEGGTTGWLPPPGEDWPGMGKRPSDSVAYQRRVSTARVEVARELEQHGGPAGD